MMGQVTAVLHGGIADGQTLTVDEKTEEILVSQSLSGQFKYRVGVPGRGSGNRYVFDHQDDDGKRHYRQAPGPGLRVNVTVR